MSETNSRTVEQRRALALFEQACDLEAGGKFTEACEFYAKAYKLDPELERQ